MKGNWHLRATDLCLFTHKNKPFFLFPTTSRCFSITGAFTRTYLNKQHAPARRCIGADQPEGSPWHSPTCLEVKAAPSTQRVRHQLLQDNQKQSWRESYCISRPFTLGWEQFTTEKNTHLKICKGCAAFSRNYNSKKQANPPCWKIVWLKLGNNSDYFLTCSTQRKKITELLNRHCREYKFSKQSE